MYVSNEVERAALVVAEALERLVQHVNDTDWQDKARAIRKVTEENTLNEFLSWFENDSGEGEARSSDDPYANP